MIKLVLRIINFRLNLILLIFIASSNQALACTTCSRPLQAAIFDAGILKLFLLLLLPFLLVWALVFLLHKLK